jgi:TIR domain
VIKFEGDKVSKIWVTYAWADNPDGDIDFIAQELRHAGLEVLMDKWSLVAGRRLWEQIDRYITDPTESDARVLVATQNSLHSEPCREELAYALNRALSKRGSGFPMIAVVPAGVDHDLLPTAIRTRLYVSLSDPQWAPRVAAGAKGQPVGPGTPTISLYVLRVHPDTGKRAYAIEMRPRAGVWAPFLAAIPLDEREAVQPSLFRGPSGQPPRDSVLMGTCRGEDPQKQWWVMTGQQEATPTTSFYLMCDRLPSKVHFGTDVSDVQYTMSVIP